MKYYHSWSRQDADYSKGSTRNRSRWSALDSNATHPVFYGDENQEGVNRTNMSQSSFEEIVIKDSADVEVHTTDTQAAVALQAALQAAITLVVSITIADSSKAEKVTQELLQQANFKQTNVQKTVIENSRNVKVTTTDTDLAVSIQILLQVLISLVVELDIL
jgi:spore coat protein X